MTYESTVRDYAEAADGRHANPSNPIERISPASGHLVARFAQGTAEEAEGAIKVARKAFDNGPWPLMSGMERAAVLRRWADLIEHDKERLARIEVDEVGKPIRLARGDIDGVIALTQYAASLAMSVHGETYSNLGPNKTAWIHREPVGVVGMIVPWNFPALIYAQKVPFALAAGCVAIVKPTVFDHVEPGMAIFREEIFGPVLSVTRFRGIEHAIEYANDTIYGLANTIWTKNFDIAHQVAPRLRSGTVWINTTIDGAPQLPFGGYKASGFGREMGQAGLDEFTNIKTVVAKLGKREPFFSVEK